MNDEACRIFLNLITLSVRMMPVFVCLEPKVKSRENIASISAYLWVIMTFLQFLFRIPACQLPINPKRTVPAAHQQAVCSGSLSKPAGLSAIKPVVFVS